MSDITHAIITGELDDQLDDITGAVEERRARIARSESAEFSAGDRVVFNSNTRPMRHIGQQATVLGPAPRKGNARPKLLVRIDGQERAMRVPAAIIDKMRV